MISVIGEKIPFVVELPYSALVLKRFIIVLHPFDAPAEFQRMGSMCPKYIVIVLKIIKGVNVVGTRTDAAQHPIPCSIDLYLGGILSRQSTQRLVYGCGIHRPAGIKIDDI